MDIGEVAARAGVSRSTVSYALSGKRPISAATRKRIEAVMAELDFVPNAAAQALKSGTTGVIALSLPAGRGDHLLAGQLSLVGSITEAAAEREYDVLLSPTGATRTNGFARMLAQRRIDGVIAMEIEIDDARVRQLLNSNTPFVAVGHTDDASGYDWVDVDHEFIVSECVANLAARGRRRLALINRSAAMVRARYSAAIRAQASFRVAVRRHGLTGEVFTCPDEMGAGPAFVRRLLAKMPDVDGIVTINEESLPTLLPALAASGKRVPDDVAVTGIALPHVAKSLAPALSACDLPLPAMGEIAVEQLLTRLTGGDHPRDGRLLRPRLVVRGT